MSWCVMSGGRYEKWLKNGVSTKGLITERVIVKSYEKVTVKNAAWTEICFPYVYRNWARNYFFFFPNEKQNKTDA